MPPSIERERIASLLRRDLAAVTARFWMFAGLDPDNPSAGRPAGARERRAWRDYADRRMDLLIDADEILDARKSRPGWLYRR